MRNLEIATYFCDDYLAQELKHSPLINDIDLFDFMFENRFYVDFYNYWRNSITYQYYSFVLMEDGMCITFNPLSANLIFRNDTVDPKFLKRRSFGSSTMEPQSWNIETGYTANTNQFYPLKSLRKGAESGLEVVLVASVNKTYEDLDRHCRWSPEYIKIALHHPAEVALKTNFINMPFHKIVLMMVKPKITTTSENLRTYDPNV
jgi:hypothetical protein